MSLRDERTIIIEELEQTNDPALLKAVKALIDYSYSKKPKQEASVPDWHKRIVRKRLTQAKKHPETLLTWNEMMKELDS